jgi:HAD superfamily hydrolase (TIGR01509 family)
MRYRAVLFDLFDTLVRFDRTRLPEIRVDGTTVRSTAAHLLPLLAPHAPGLDLPRLYEALLWSWQEAERRRGADHREVRAEERFGLLLGRLGLEPSRLPAGVIEALITTHQRLLAGAAELPEGHRRLVRRLAARYRLAVVSNFDYAPTAHGILGALAPLFRTVVVSADVGWRKPKPVIFDVALAALGVRPAEALFVGDRAEIDVLGAKGVGMGAAWLNPEAQPCPAGVPAPDFELRALEELEPLLARPGGPR